MILSLRGLGPSAGGTWRFNNPTVTLIHQKTDGTWETLGTNSDWTAAVPQTGGPVVLENIMTQVSASALTRTSGDAALYMQLDAGNYQAQLTATGGSVIFVDLLQPSGVTVGSDGSVLVADSRALWKVAGGITTRIATTGMLSPGGLITDAAGNFYVVDEGNSQILKVTTAGAVSTFAGLSGSTGFRDGLGAAARFNGPRGITIDGSSNLYVTDTGNSAIRKIDLSGNVSTLIFTAGSDNNPPVVVPPVVTPPSGGGGGGGGGGAINPFIAAFLALLTFVRWFSGAKKNAGGNA